MIFDKMSNISDYYDEYPKLKKVGEFAERIEQENLTDGSYEIDGKDIFANIMTYKSKQQTDESMFEAHKDYIDVQYIIQGVEKIRFAPLDSVELVEERYSKGNDIAFYEGYSKFDFILTKGTFLYLTPDEAHLPGLSADKDVTVRKVVFKVHI